MIKIIDIAEKLNNELSELFMNKEVLRFRISVNLDFSLDVNVVSDTMSKEDFENRYLKEFDGYKISCEVYTSSEAEDEYVQPIFSAGNGIDYGQRFRLASLFDKEGSKPHTIVNRDALPPIVTFYSYKGGMGRTTTMVSYAIKLALQGKRVFIIDADLEAPGYLNFFDLPEHQGLREGKINGLVEYLSDLEFSRDKIQDAKNGKRQLSLQDYCLNIYYGNREAGLDPRLGNIYLMPAGNLNETMQNSDQMTSTMANRHLRAYMEGLSRINLGNIWTVLQNFNKLLKQIKDTFDPDVVLIDSRTGFNDVMGTATNYLSDVIVGFFGSNQQTIPGLKKLLQSYQENDFKLLLINSILPDKQELRAEGNFKKLNGYIEEFYRFEDIIRDRPLLYRLHRLPALEQLGIENDMHYLELIEKNEFEDYKVLFDQLNLVVQEVLQSGKVAFKESHRNNDSPASPVKKKKDPRHMDTWSLRNRILQGLKWELEPITDFAEDQQRMNPRTFFYRRCMNLFFDRDKFLIMGYKGTGKTYLYRALTEPTDKNEEIARVILQRANKYRSSWNIGAPMSEDVNDYKFIDVISATSAGVKRLDFAEIDYDSIHNPQLYFKRLWQVHTWLSILQDPDFEQIKQESGLSKLIIDDFTGIRGLKAFDEIIKMGVDALIVIEDDMRKIDKWCNENNKQLYLLYDQLDTRINPRYWDNAVSPLINYWRENFALYSNLCPKIFVRTDLFQRIGGTNTARMKNNIVSIEWNIDEIFSYIVKLIVCNEERKECFIEMLNRVYKGNATMTTRYEKEFAENNNQLFKADVSSLTPLIKVIFGKEVTGKRGRSTPYDYFAWNMANADRATYSLRPFITTLDKNAIVKTLARIIPNRYVQWLIAPADYANRDVRNQAAQQYFDDLTRDEFSADLIKFRDVLQSDKGKSYRKKTLREIEFNDLINLVMDSYSDFTAAKTGEDLKLMLYASGIMAEKPISGEKIYRFAPLYFYHWGLKSTRYERELDRFFDEDDTDE